MILAVPKSERCWRVLGMLCFALTWLPKPWLDANFSTQNRHSMTFGASVTNFFASVGLKNESIVKLFFDMVADVLTLSFEFEMFRNNIGTDMFDPKFLSAPKDFFD